MKIFTTLAVTALCTMPALQASADVITRSDAAPEKRSQSLSTVNEQRTVLARKQLADGVTKRVVRDARGRIFCDMVRGGKVSKAPGRVKVPMRAPADASFYEGFEGHNGELDWLPEGWTEINTPANTPTMEMCQHNINNSWCGQDTGDGYWTGITSDGVKEAWVHFTYNWSYKNGEGETISGQASPQDEWLISPQFTVGQGHDLFFLLEFDYGAAYGYDWDTMAYDRSEVECDMEVLVSEDNGANWTSLWKVTDDVCSQMTDSQMYDVMAELGYSNYNVSLARYYGKNVKLAFRYTNASKGGLCGNSAAVDGITVAAPAAVAEYNIPEGNLLVGMSDGLTVYPDSRALMPAYTDITWTAGSNIYTSANQWTFYDADGSVGRIINDGEAVVNYPYSEGQLVKWPMLTASNATNSDIFSYDGKDEQQGGIFFGGKVPDFVWESGSEEMYVGNYDYKHKGLITPYLDTTDYVYGTHTAGGWGTGITQTKFGNLFMAPPAPLTVTDVLLTLGEYDADADAEFLLEIFPVDDRGTVAETPAATAKVKGSDISGFGFYPVKFTLSEPYVMTGNTLMMISGYANNPKVRTFAACAQSVHNDAAHNYCYMIYDINGESVFYSAAEALQDYSSALMLSLNGTYHFVTLVDENQQIMQLDATTGTAEVDFKASNAPENWWVEDGENRIPLVAEGATYDWLKVFPVTREDGSYAVRFSAQPSQAQRSKTVVVANDGGNVRLRVRQSAAPVGIDGIAADDLNMRVSGNILTVSGLADDTLVEIYATSGLRVLAGDRTLNISALPAGVYLVKAANKVFRLRK